MHEKMPNVIPKLYHSPKQAMLISSFPVAYRLSFKVVSGFKNKVEVALSNITPDAVAAKSAQITGTSQQRKKIIITTDTIDYEL